MISPGRILIPTGITLLLILAFWGVGAVQSRMLITEAELAAARSRGIELETQLRHALDRHDRTDRLRVETEQRIREARKLARDKAYDKLAKFLEAVDRETALQTSGDLYVTVSFNDNKLFMKRNGAVLKEFPVSLGSGKIFESEKRRWIFETPRGVFPVKAKKENPVWIKPDWAFLEKGEPIPPLEDPVRKIRGFLGPYGVYLGEGYLIHGAPPGQEDTIGLNLSHGCIRMKPEDLQEVYNTIEVGTNVLIR